MRFNPPPNWPRPPEGWTPPPGWQPDPAWGPPPVGWPLWQEDAPTRPRSWFLRHKLLTGLGALLAVGAIGSVVDGGDPERSGTPAGLTGPVPATSSSAEATAAVTAPVPTAVASSPTGLPSPPATTRTTTTTTPTTKVVVKPKSSATKAAAKPLATKKSTPKKSTTSVRSGVHPGSFCSPTGALGRTSSGTLMKCKPSATDARSRWRKA